MIIEHHAEFISSAKKMRELGLIRIFVNNMQDYANLLNEHDGGISHDHYSALAKVSLQAAAWIIGRSDVVFPVDYDGAMDASGAREGHCTAMRLIKGAGKCELSWFESNGAMSEYFLSAAAVSSGQRNSVVD